MDNNTQVSVSVIKYEMLGYVEKNTYGVVLTRVYLLICKSVSRKSIQFLSASICLPGIGSFNFDDASRLTPSSFIVFPSLLDQYFILLVCSEYVLHLFSDIEAP